MPDLTMSVTMTRTLLALSALELNDHVNYYAAPSSPAQVSWQHERVSSRWVDDDFTVSRRRPKVVEEMTFEVLAGAVPTAATLQTNIGALITAASQDSYTLTVTIDGTSYAWACESADYQVIWSGPRMVARQAQVRLLVPRSPIPSAGPF